MTGGVESDLADFACLGKSLDLREELLDSFRCKNSVKNGYPTIQKIGGRCHRTTLAPPPIALLSKKIRSRQNRDASKNEKNGARKW